MTDQNKSSKLGALCWLGAGDILTYPISGLVSYALIASLFGEGMLEKSEGGITVLGSLAQAVPILLGVLLIVVDVKYKPQISNPWKLVGTFGLVIGAVGASAVRTANPAESLGPNIGAGILVLAGITLMLTAVVLKFVRK